MELPYGIVSQLLLLVVAGITGVGALALVAAVWAMGRSGYRKD